MARPRESGDGRRARRLHAIRGATTVARDDRNEILSATWELLLAMTERNGLVPADVVSAIFTLTTDVASEFPAIAARAFGWTQAALLCTMELPVPGALARTIRVLVHVEFEEPRTTVEHVYLREAITLRPDLAANSGGSDYQPAERPR